ncbi:hypothetical protein CPB86DRAFT_337580 [Serendipita vermifera]|nr:hypothetical protein CPB86DRAFT_337580 [Serendipita vermifera]
MASPSVCVGEHWTTVVYSVLPLFVARMNNNDKCDIVTSGKPSNSPEPSRGKAGCHLAPDPGNISLSIRVSWVKNTVRMTLGPRTQSKATISVSPMMGRVCRRTRSAKLSAWAMSTSHIRALGHLVVTIRTPAMPVADSGEAYVARPVWSVCTSHAPWKYASSRRSRLTLL